MSTNKLRHGFMAELSAKIDGDTINEILDQKGSALRVNYEGTLIYKISDEMDLEDTYGITFCKTEDANEFFEECWNMGFGIKGKPQPYLSIWYNGTDPHTDIITVEDFRKMIAGDANG